MLTTINKISCNLNDEMKKKNNLISIVLVIVLIACSPTIDDSAETSLSNEETEEVLSQPCLLYTSPSPRDRTRSRMPSSA